MTGAALDLHASCVAFRGKGVLIRGASGRGKSALALELMALGAELVADDRVLVEATGAGPVARAPERLAGMIEARSVGLLRATPVPEAQVHLVIDMDHTETRRLPPDRDVDLAGHRLPLFHKVESGHFAAAILQYLRGGKVPV